MQKIKYLATVLLICYVINVPVLINNILKLSLPKEFLFWVLPVLVVYIIAINEGKFKMPLWWLFLILSAWFILNESTFIRPNVIPNYTYLIGIIKFYSIYLAFLLVSSSNKTISTLLKITLIIIIPFVLVFYLVYTGLIDLNIQNSYVGFDYNLDRFVSGDLIDINGVSLVASFGILVSILLKQYFDKNFLSDKYFYIILLFLLTIIMLHATRGAFLISLLSIVYYLYNVNRHRIKFAQILVISIITILYLSFEIFGSSYIFDRFTSANYESLGRTQQVIASFENFIQSPFWGLGYNNAGYNPLLNTTRSNFHYTQVLASLGIFWSISYFFFLYLIILKNKYPPLKIYFAFFSLLSLAFYNWTGILPMSVLAAINYSSRK